MAWTGHTVEVRLPHDDAPELEWLIFGQSGVLTYRQAVDAIGRARVRRMIHAGRWRNIIRGVLLTQNGELTRAQQLWVAVLVAGPGALLAGAAAAAESSVRGLRGDPIDVLVPASRVRTDLLRQLPPDMTGVVVHRTTVLPRDHVQVGRPTRTTLPRAVVDAASWARSNDEARTIVASACQQRRVTAEELDAVVDVLPRMPRRALVRATIADIAGGAQALSEIDFVRLCRRFRLPEPDLQERRRDAAGRLRFLDAYWRKWRLHVEVDGAHHMEVRHWEADLRRQNEVWIPGDRVLRFSSYQVRRRQTEVADQLRRALLASGWQPPPATTQKS